MNGFTSVLRRGDVQGMTGLIIVRRVGDAAFPVALLVGIALTRGLPEAALIVGIRVAASAISSPFRARLLDRFGPRRLVPLQSVVTVLALTGFVLAAATRSAPAVVVILAGIIQAISSPSVDAVIRTQWRVLSNSDEEIRSLHALDSIIEEASYLVGPTLASVALIVFGAQNAMLLLGGVVGVGVLLAYLPKTLRAALRAEPPTPSTKAQAKATPPTLRALARALAGPIVDSNLQRIVTPLLLLGTALGSLGVLVPAISQSMGNIGYSGFLFSAISVGGLIGGLWYGAAKLKSRLSSRQAVFSIVLGAPLILGIWALNPWLLAPILIVSGLAVTPLYINAYLMMDQDLPKAVAHEANTWVSVGNNLGYTFGIVLGGWLLSATGIGSVGVLVTAVGAATVVFAIVVLFRSRRPTSENMQSEAVEAN